MLNGERILIFGGSGSLGHTLAKRYIPENEVFIYSRGENQQWRMKQIFCNDEHLSFFVGDIRDRERVETCIFRCRPTIVIIAAALKHIDICEKNVNECINTNVDGVRNVVNIVSDCSMRGSIPFLKTVVFISTDKACAPVNAYGMCKAISERIMVEKTEFLSGLKFVNVRYGNVLQSRGSLIPLFKSIGTDPDKHCFTITDEKMTRFFMSLEESVNLITYAILHGNSGDTIVPKNIQSYRIADIASYFSLKYNKPISVTGIRPGEKLHEMLISFTEGLRTEDTGEYYVIRPTYANIIQNHATFSRGEFESSSTLDMNKETLKTVLEEQVAISA